MQRPSLLVEVLIGGAIIAVIVTICAFAIQDARARLRDAVRLSHARQTMAVLDRAFQDRSSYPPGDRIALGDPSESRCLTADGFRSECSPEDTLLFPVMSTIDIGLDGLSVCGEPTRNAFCYSQIQDGKSYQIEFEIERSVSYTDLVPGAVCATPDGLSPGPC